MALNSDKGKTIPGQAQPRVQLAAPVATPHKPCQPNCDLQTLEALIGCDAAWAEAHLPILRGAVLLMRQTSTERRARLAALDEAAPAIMRANVELLDREIVHFTLLTALLRRARARLLLVGGRADLRGPTGPSDPPPSEAHPQGPDLDSRA